MRCGETCVAVPGTRKSWKLWKRPRAVERSRSPRRRRCNMSGKRTVLGMAAVAIAIASASVAGAAEPIRIGELNSYTAEADFTRPYRNGWIMAIEEINAAGGVLGRALEMS